ncbi:MAG: nucleotidyltransferase [Verrucomicrobia bacterium]|nr:nucleotidyltransferase [Verrucomicrobiota bacterium]
MAIPELQLETWSHQGAIQGSAATYQAIKGVLESSQEQFASSQFQVFLQGSYGNDTNVYAESDVDVVIRYDGAYYYDTSFLGEAEKLLFQANLASVSYPYQTYRQDVMRTLAGAFGASVAPGNNSIKIGASGSLRSADVVPAFEYRRFTRYQSILDNSYIAGIAFIRTDGTFIANFPKLHSSEATLKHQRTMGNFKPMVRIFKNIRSRLVTAGKIEAGSAPSYFIEGLLFNVPDSYFAGTYQSMFAACVDWLRAQQDRSNWTCVNGQYPLLRDGDPVCWTQRNCSSYLGAVAEFWFSY